MSTLLELARDLVSAINEAFEEESSEESNRGLPAEFRYLPSLDREKLPPEPALRVTLGAIVKDEEREDTCESSFERAVSVVFSKRLEQPGTVDDIGESEELDGLIDWIEQLFTTLADLELENWGKPKRIEFISPGLLDLFVMDWLTAHRLFVSVIALTFEDAE